MAPLTETNTSPLAIEPVAFDDRTRRVLELKKQVRDGTYHLDAEAVAEAILGEWNAVGDLHSSGESTPAVATADERKSAAARFVVASGPAATRSPLRAVRSA